MRAFLGRTAVYWQPFLITTIGFSLLALWYQNLPPQTLLGTGEYWLWMASTLLIGLPGMGTLCALIGARTRQLARALVAGLAGLLVSSLVALLLGGGPMAEGLVELAIGAGVPFLVGFGVTALLLRRR